MAEVSLLDYGAGNVRSIRNAIEAVGFRVRLVASPADLAAARVVVFPGVGAFGATVSFLDGQGYRAPLLAYLQSGRPFLGICLGMQTLFESSEESPGAAGLGLIPGAVARFAEGAAHSVPHIGWNGVTCQQPAGSAAAAALDGLRASGARGKVYFVHSYRAAVSAANAPWVAGTTDYGGCRYISAVARGGVFATQFHPEKSGPAGLAMFRAFLQAAERAAAGPPAAPLAAAASDAALAAAILDAAAAPTRVCRRVVACLDVRSNDAGDLVVTKGDQYDVREHATAGGGKPAVRNLGKPVELCARYYDEGADEVAFLNITAFRDEPLDDTPMLAVLEAASERVFVPLTVRGAPLAQSSLPAPPPKHKRTHTSAPRSPPPFQIGGGIRGYTDSKGCTYTPLDVAARYFRSGADKVSIGSDAVTAAEAYYARGCALDGGSAIEAIAAVYGRQAVVVSVDPRRVWLRDAAEAAAAAAAGHVVLAPRDARGPGGETQCWYQCTIKGGREGRPLCAVRLARAVEALGAGELLVNCVDADGQKAGFDAVLLGAVCGAVAIPVIASSGAGCPEHFSRVFADTRVEAALAAGIFHRREVAIADVKRHLVGAGVETRIVE